MSLVQLLKAIVGLFCGPTTKPQQVEQQPQPGQGQQQQGYPAQGQQQQAYPPSGQWQQQQHKLSSSPSYDSKKHEDANELNQSNECVSLRAQANEHGDQMAKCFQQSHEAYSRGDGALAKDLSNQGKDHQRKMEKLNKQASDYIFTENNKDRKLGEVDLHGLYVKEAIARADEAIQKAKSEGQAQINFIVGKGIHSQGGVAKIKPAIEELIQKHQLSAQLDPNNAGVLIVLINSGTGQRGIGADEISNRLERKDESCIIM